MIIIVHALFISMFNIINKVIKTISFLLYSCVYTVICEIDLLALNMNVSKPKKKLVICLFKILKHTKKIIKRVGCPWSY